MELYLVLNDTIILVRYIIYRPLKYIKLIIILSNKSLKIKSLSVTSKQDYGINSFRSINIHKVL